MSKGTVCRSLNYEARADAANCRQCGKGRACVGRELWNHDRRVRGENYGYSANRFFRIEVPGRWSELIKSVILKRCPCLTIGLRSTPLARLSLGG